MLEYSIPFVCAFGILTVFCSLLIIVLLSTAMSAIIRRLEKATAAPAESAEKTVPPVSAPAPAAADAGNEVDDPQLIAAITAAIAEDLGENFTGIRITAIRKAISTIDPQLIATITAAIAEDLGVNFNQVKITAIQQL